jgi:hypothetical protein
MVRLSGASGQFPRSLFLDDLQAETSADSRVERVGGFANVYRGTYHGKPVAIKQPRFFGELSVAHSACLPYSCHVSALIVMHTEVVS